MPRSHPRCLPHRWKIPGNLRQLQDSHDPLIITFHERTQRFQQSYLVDVDRERGTIALDEMIPRDGERFMLAGEPFKVEGFHEGVRIAWGSNGQLTIDESGDSRCYRVRCQMKWFITSVATLRAALKLAQLVNVDLDGEKLKAPISGKLLDIPATAVSCALKVTSPKACNWARSTTASPPPCLLAK